MARGSEEDRGRRGGDPFDFPREVIDLVDAVLAEAGRHGRGRRQLDPSHPTQLLFHNPASEAFSFGWQQVDPVNRWLFPVQAEGVRFVYYVTKRLQDLGHQPGKVLFATRGEGALFYATVDSADKNSAGVVGMLPKDTPPFDFGSTLNSFAPNAQMTVLSNASAADNVDEGVTYLGSELVGQLALYVGGTSLASDAAVVCNADGAATTTGNIWQGDPATGQAAIQYPAPGGGRSQAFPL